MPKITQNTAIKLAKSALNSSPSPATLDSTLHPFAGCNRLLEQYQMIGRALIEFESGGCAILLPRNSQVSAFSVSVALVPVEVLEGYLDDLLDMGIGDEALFIKRPKFGWFGRGLLAVLACALCSAFSVWHGDISTAALPAIMVIAFLAGIASTLYLLPKAKAIRRFSFATLLSQEVNKRRGHNGDKLGLIRDILGFKTPANFPARFNHAHRVWHGLYQ